MLMENGMPYKISRKPQPKKSMAGRPPLYPFAKLAKGECFEVENVSRSSLAVSAQYWSRKTGFKFSVRQLEGRVGIWRVA